MVGFYGSVGVGWAGRSIAAGEGSEAIGPLEIVDRHSHPSQMPVTLSVPPRSSAVKVPMPETVTAVPALAVWGIGPPDGEVTASVPRLALKVSVELACDVTPQVAVVCVVMIVSWT